ncbi:hypothetical protein VTJ04DRAFT_4379, partial [Mycothermus thermophilus]|uniref:uncharacterized protein n=1 Tax=Humicola insolens TaxID=85995 RepID=UPI0037434820
MVASALALSLIGLGAVQALPAPSRRQESKRQVLIGDGNTVIIPGQGEFPICQIDIPLKEQPPCLFLPIPGPITPEVPTPSPTLGLSSAARRPVAKRGAVIGDPTTVLIPGV